MFYVTIIGSEIRNSNHDTKQAIVNNATESENGQTEEDLTSKEQKASANDAKVDETTNETTSEASGETTEQSEEEALEVLLLRDMTLEEKVGQLFVIRPEALHPYATFLSVNDTEKYGVTGLDAEMLDTLRKYKVGGVIYFRKNVIYPEQLENFTRDMQANCTVPLFVGIDEEGGDVTRIAGAKGFDVPSYPSMEQVGSTGNVDEARAIGESIGSYLTDYGINVNFAPVADVNTNPNNRVIGNRSFGSDPNIVSSMVKAAIEGYHSQSIMTVTKHFPGHGDASADTHAGVSVIDKTWEELNECELLPFYAAMEAGTDFIMVAHITLPNVTSDGLPASLSKELITGKLREELGYDGLIITDSLSMGAIYNNYTAAEASVLAVKAGADVLLMPANFIEAYDAVLAAVQSGEIPEEQIDKSVLRILRVKQNLQ